jgi:hypothetical protein
MLRGSGRIGVEIKRSDTSSLTMSIALEDLTVSLTPSEPVRPLDYEGEEPLRPMSEQELADKAIRLSQQMTAVSTLERSDLGHRYRVGEIVIQ